MATNVTLNGSTYSIPAEGDSGWGTALSNYFIAIGAGVLQKTGGTFTLTAETNFGATYGLKSAYLKSQATNPSATGIIRLGNAENVSWRNAANGADLALSVNASNNLQFNSANVLTAGGALIVNADISAAAAIAYSKLNLASSIVNADIANAAAIAYSKLSLTGAILNADLAGAIAYSKLSLTGAILNADLAGAIAYSKLSLTGAILNADLAGSIAYSKLSLTGAILNADLAGSIAYSKLSLTGALLNADINASAAIALSKLAALGTAKALQSNAATGAIEVSSVTNTELGYVSGVTSAIQTQLNAKSSLTGVETFTNKTIGDALTLTEVSTPSTPSAGLKKIYPKSDGKLYTLNSAGTETEVGSGSGGGINYITYNDGNVATGWATYADAAGSIPVDGTGGSANITWGVNTSTPLRGTSNFQLVKDAANRQGQGVSYDFSIDLADSLKPKMMQISFDFNLVSGTYDSGTSTTNSDLIAYIYCVTDGVLIEPAGMKIQSGMPFKATFQTRYSNSSTKQQYRLILHQSLTGTSAYTMQFDNFSVGPQVTASGYAAYVDKTVTVTGSWVSNTTYTATESRSGGDAIYKVKVALAGAPTATTLSINLPSGRVIDTARVTSTSNGVAEFGEGTAFDNGVTFYPAVVTYNSTTAVNVSALLASGTYATNSLVSSTVPFTFGNTDTVEVTFTVPIVGWDTNTVASSETDTRVVSCSVNTLSSTTMTSGTALSFTSVTKDTHGGWSTNGYTVKVPGDYTASFGEAAISSGSANIRAYVNGVAGKYIVSLGTATRNSGYVLIPDLKTGDVISFVPDSSVTATGTTPASAYITRLSGPAQITATESIDARYTNVAGTTLTKSADNKIPFATKDYDTHGAWVTDTFTAPAPGKYPISAKVVIATGATWANGDFIQIDIFKNGASVSGDIFYINAAITGAIAVRIADKISCVTGDLLTIHVNPTKAAAGNVTLNTTAGFNSVTIGRAGN